VVDSVDRDSKQFNSDPAICAYLEGAYLIGSDRGDLS
jgi:hypothetical protein